MSGGLGVSCEFFPTMCNALATLDDLTYDSDRECQTPDPVSYTHLTLPTM